ncbi:MAG: ComEA family DNA-binding protein [Frankiaceae bacterium]|nr:ComEA family DNA-binding protein [Frankiaceae bacterium]
MTRPRPDPVAAGARLAALVPSHVTGGWVPPPLPVPHAPSELTAAPPRIEPAAAEPSTQSWSERAHPEDGDAAGSAPVAGLLDSLVPAGLRGGRWDPGRQGVAALACVAVIGALLAGVVLLRARPQPVDPPPLVRASAEATSGGVVVVDVAGKVRHPGIVRLPLGARVDDAVRAAGGPLPGATFDGLNRARKLTDGEQVVVGVPPAAGSSSTAGQAAGDARVDLNLADVGALDGLPGIGPVLAQKIVDWRTEHGRFASVDQLREVSGIGESKFAALKNKVRV